MPSSGHPRHPSTGGESSRDHRGLSLGVGSSIEEDYDDLLKWCRGFHKELRSRQPSTIGDSTLNFLADRLSNQEAQAWSSVLYPLMQYLTFPDESLDYRIKSIHSYSLPLLYRDLELDKLDFTKPVQEKSTRVLLGDFGHAMSNLVISDVSSLRRLSPSRDSISRSGGHRSNDDNHQRSSSANHSGHHGLPKKCHKMMKYATEMLLCVLTSSYNIMLHKQKLQILTEDTTEAREHRQSSPSHHFEGQHWILKQISLEFPAPESGVECSDVPGQFGKLCREVIKDLSSTEGVHAIQYYKVIRLLSLMSKNLGWIKDSRIAQISATTVCNTLLTEDTQ